MHTPKKRIGAFKRVTSPHAKFLRSHMTDAETKLWFHVRDRRLGGHKVRTQVTIDPYVVDFHCIDKGLIVEVDGNQHNETVDARRTMVLEGQGYQILRFWNIEVLPNIEPVLEGIVAALETLPSRLNRGGDR